nr:IS66 family transposase [Endozoicomonas sp. SESOKO1]
MRFTEGVPVELIHIPAPEMQGEDADQYEIIDHKYTHRLVQRPGSYVILKYQRDVVRHKGDQTLSTAAAPSGLFDRSFADVSFIARLLVEKYPKITHAECWTHSRRYFVKSEKAEPEATKEALKQIGALYKVEDDIRRQGLEGDTLRDYRQQKAKPLVDQFFEWNREQRRRLDLVPGNPLSKALGYVHKREKSFRYT